MRKFLPGFLLAFAFCTSGFASFASAEPVYNPEILAGPEYDFRKITWRMTVDEVKASENKRVAEEGVYKQAKYNSYYVAYMNVPCAGANAYLIYVFYNDSLYMGTMLFFSKTDIHENLKQAAEDCLGPFDKQKTYPDSNSIALLWYRGDTVVRLISDRAVDEDGEYRFNLAFFDSSTFIDD